MHKMIAALAITALLTAPVAHADDDANYLRILHAAGIGNDAPPSILIELGHDDVCKFFGDGMTFDNIVTDLQRAAEQGNISELIDPIGARYLVDAAVNVYCPQYKSQLK